MHRSRYCPKERYSYLQELVMEYQDSSSTEGKEQVLANLGNFAYDPRNYEHFRKLNVVSLFLDNLDEENEKFIEYAIGGLCNLALDKSFKELILSKGGVSKIICCLSSTHEETVLSAITTLMYLVTPQSKLEITSPSVIDCMLRFSQSGNRRLSNLACVFLQDYCTPQLIEEAKALALAHQGLTETKTN